MSEFIVQLTVTSSHEYTLSAKSETDAVDKAASLFEGGDQGLLLEFDVETVDVVDSWGEDDEEEFD